MFRLPLRLPRAASRSTPMRRNTWLAGLGLVAGVVLGGATRAGATVLLSNTPVHPEDAGTLFEGSVPTIWAETTQQTGDVQIHSVAYRGMTGTRAAGFFLYSYEIESLNPGSVYVTDFFVDVAGRVAFDLDGDTIDETSAYCSHFCVSDLTGAVPEQVSVAAGDTVDFHFALLEHSTQLWIVSTHPPATVAATVTRAFGTGDVAIDVVAPAASTAGSLSNVPLTWGTPPHTRMAQLFGINLGAWPGGDGYALGVHFYTGARAGIAGTAAEGLYLYEYWFETGECAGNSTLVRRLDIPFASLVPFDIDGDGTNETSFYMPYSTGGCGPATVADAVEIDGNQSSFSFPSGVAAGMANAFVVSDLPPNEVEGILTMQGLGTGPFRTWSSAPEPAATFSAAAAGLALVLLRRRARR